MIPRRLVNNYANSINRISLAAQVSIEKSLRDLDVSDVAQARDAIISVMDEVLGKYTDAAATLAGAFYNECRSIELGKLTDVIVDSCRVPDKTHESVRAFMQIIVNGGTVEQLIGKLKERADYEIKVAANSAVMYCGEHDANE